MDGYFRIHAEDLSAQPVYPFAPHAQQQSEIFEAHEAEVEGGSGGLATRITEGQGVACTLTSYSPGAWKRGATNTETSCS
jgi:hypothetical protein